MNLDFTLKVDDVETDPDANQVFLSSPDDSFGVRRIDTDATVVANGALMTRLSAGVYRYNLIEPEPDLGYEYYVEWVLDGALQRVHRFAGSLSGGGGSPDPNVVGRYASRYGMNERFGKDNVDKWASVSSDQIGSQIDAITSAIAMADDFIDDALRGGLVKTIPFETPVPTTIINIANNLAAAYLYEAKGVKDYDEAGNVQHRLSYQKRWAMEQLDRVRRGVISLGLRTTNTIPLIID